MKHIVLVIWVLLGFQVESILFYGDDSNYFGAINVSDGGLFQAEQRNIGVGISHENLYSFDMIGILVDVGGDEVVERTNIVYMHENRSLGGIYYDFFESLGRFFTKERDSEWIRHGSVGGDSILVGERYNLGGPEQRNIGVENPIARVETQENRAAVLLLDDSKSDIAIEDGKSEDGVQLGQNLGEFFGVEYKTWVKYPEHLAGPFTGGFGEQSCHSCHFDYDLNMPDGVLELKGLPGVVEPGKRYELEVLISRPDIGAAGFQLTSRFENGSQAGNFILNDEIIFTPNTSGDSVTGATSGNNNPGGKNSRSTDSTDTTNGGAASVNNQNGASPKPIDVTGGTPGGTVSGNTKYSGKNNGVLQYVQHAVKNIDPENGQKIWKFSWTAPDQIHANAGKIDSEANGSKSQRIIFNLAGNAANGDESAFEDWILLKEFRIDIENE